MVGATVHPRRPGEHGERGSERHFTPAGPAAGQDLGREFGGRLLLLGGHEPVQPRDVGARREVGG